MEYILGVVVSLGVQKLKNWTRVGEWGVLAVIAGASILAAWAYTALAAAGYWESISQILITAGAFHNFVIRRFE